MKNYILIFFIFFTQSFISCNNNNTEQKFEKEKWKNGTQIDRGNMITDLMDNKNVYLIGKTQSEIIELLGHPKSNEETIFLYLIDFGYMTPFYFEITFDKTKHKVYEISLSD